MQEVYSKRDRQQVTRAGSGASWINPHV